MSEKTVGISSGPNRIIAALRELINALDRRVPQAGRASEIRIASDAQALRREAVARIEALGRNESVDHLREQVRVNAVMTDDGGPGE